MKRRRSQTTRNRFGFARLEPRQLLAGDLGSLNLLTNGDFSTVPAVGGPDLFDSADVAGWNAANAGDGQQIALYTFGTGDDVNTVLKLDSSDQHVDNVFQEVTTEAGGMYIITFDLRGQEIDGTTVTENVLVFWNDVLVGEFESSGIWTTHAQSVTGIAGSSRLEFREAASGEVLEGDGVGVLIDNVNIASVSDTGITNGSFESFTGTGPFFSNGSVDGWSALDRGGRPTLIQLQPNGENESAPATDGSSVLNLDTTGEHVDHVFADFATEEGRMYFLVFDMFADGDQSGANPDEVRIRWKTPDAEILTDQWIATAFGNNSWQSYGFMVAGLGDTSRLELREPSGSPGDGSGALIDNVRMYSIEGIINDLVVDANGSASGTGAVAELIQGQSRTTIAPDLTLAHASGTRLTGATVTINESVAASEDELAVDTGSTGIASSFDETTGTLTLTGSATVAQWQSVLRTLEYVNSTMSPTLGDRSISIVVTDDAILGSDDDSEAAIVVTSLVTNSLSIAPIAAQTVEAGSPLWVTLDVTNPADVPLQYTGVSGDASILTPRFETGDSWRLNISAPDAETGGVSTPLEGEITFQLFENIFGAAGSRAADRIRTLTNQQFYDGQRIHRIDSDFVIQGGDPTATGSGGSDLGEFDDQFSTLLQHNRTGLLSYAKSFDDTNDSQFFITDTATRFLDYQHTIFGVLTSGEELRESLANVDVGVDPANPRNTEFPTAPVTITSAEIYQDNQRAALLLVAPEGVTGETTLTVTVRDENGNESMQTINVNIVEPSGPNTDSNPFLDDIPDLDGFFGVEQTYQLTSQDVENDSVRYLDLEQINVINSGLSPQFRIGVPTFAGDDSFTYSVDIDTGLVTFTPGLEGESPSTVEFVVGVAQEPRPGEPINNGNVDLQVITLNLTNNMSQ